MLLIQLAITGGSLLIIYAIFIVKNYLTAKPSDSMVIQYCKEDDVFINEEGKSINIPTIQIDRIFKFKKRKYIITKIEDCENGEVRALARITQ